MFLFNEDTFTRHYCFQVLFYRIRMNEFQNISRQHFVVNQANDDLVGLEKFFCVYIFSCPEKWKKRHELDAKYCKIDKSYIVLVSLFVLYITSSDHR